jgi:hypothetical protein
MAICRFDLLHNPHGIPEGDKDLRNFNFNET